MHQSVKRTQGRPVRGSGDVGREKLLEGARAFFRSKLTLDISRQEIAKSAGVTAALVSYYFPDKNSLIAAATKPILEGYINEVTSIVGSGEDHVHRLRRLVALFIRFSAKDAGILNVFLDHISTIQDEQHNSLLLAALGQLTGFFQDGAKAGAWRAIDPTFIMFALWGMCKMVAEAPVLPIRMFSDETSPDRVLLKQADYVVELLINGIRAERLPEL